MVESDNLQTGRRPGVREAVFVALPEDSEGPASERVSGFVSAEYWEPVRATARPGSRPGLEAAGHQLDARATRRRVRVGQPGRGVYADTRLTNDTARSLYQALGYKLAYMMPDYYYGLDGASYLKLFPT